MMAEAMVQALEDTPPPPPSRRRRRLVGAVVAVIVLAAAVGVFLVHRSVSRELLTATEGNTIGAFPGERVDDAFGERDVVQVAYQHGGTYTFEFTINNPSRWDVRISDFPLARDLGMLRPVNVAIDTTPFEGPDRTFTAFHPFTVGAGDAAIVQVRTRFANCDRFDSGNSATVESLPVRYRTLWATRTSDLELPTAIQVDAPQTCPAS
jgi:hypothetical protein